MLSSLLLWMDGVVVVVDDIGMVVVVSLREGSLMGTVSSWRTIRGGVVDDTGTDDGGGDIVDGSVGVVL